MCEKTLSLVLVYLNDRGEFKNYADCPCPVYKTHPEFHCSCKKCQLLFWCKCSENKNVQCSIDVGVQVDSLADDIGSFVTCDDTGPQNQLSICFSKIETFATQFLTRDRLFCFGILLCFVIIFFVGKSFAGGNSNKQIDLRSVETTVFMFPRLH